MQKKPSLLSSTLIILLVSMIAANIGGQMYGPLLPLYVQSLGASVEQVGLFFTLAMIAPLLFQILGGWLSDAIGRVQAMAIGSTAGFIGYVIFVVSPSWVWLLLAMVGMSVATSFVGPSFQAFVAEQSSESTRGRVFGIVQGVFLICGVIGAPLGGWLADKAGFRWMFIVAAALYGIATVIRLVMSRQISRKEKAAAVGKAEAPHAKPSVAHLKTSILTMIGMMVGGGIVTWMFISDGVGDVTFSMVGNLFPLYFNNVIGMTKTQLGFLSAIASIVTMALISLGGILSDKAGERVGIVLGNVFVAGALYMMLNVHSFGMFIIAWSLLGIGQALSQPAYASLISKIVPNRLRGTAFGFFSTSLGVISLPAPYIGAWLWEKFNPRLPFYVPLIAMLLMLPVIWIKFKLPKVDPSAPPTGDIGGEAPKPIEPAAVLEEPQGAGID